MSLSDFEVVKCEFIGKSKITIIPVSDVHLGAIECAEREWQQFCEWVQRTPDVYLILGGDLINNTTRTSVANVFTEAYRPATQKELMTNYLMPIRDRILCAVSGNHERRSMKDADSDITHDIMCRLGCEDRYRVNMVFLHLVMRGKADDKTHQAGFTIGVTHGAGGGIYTGAAVNRNERFGNVIDGLDMLLVGHTHKQTVSRPSKIVFNAISDTVYIKPYYVVTMASWLNFGGYALQKMLLPSDVATPQQIILSGTRSEQKHIQVITGAIEDLTKGNN